MSINKKKTIVIVSAVLAMIVIALAVVLPIVLKKRDTDRPDPLPSISLDGPKSIVSEPLAETMSIYSTFDIASCYGFCNNYKFPVTAKITKPDSTEVTTRKEFVAESAGVYRVELSSQIGEELVTKTVDINVDGYGPGYLFDCANASMTGETIGVLPKDADGNDIHNIKTDYIVGNRFKLLSSGSVIRYKNVVDLRSVSGNLIEMVPNVGEDWFELTKIRVRLTDAYDASNSVSVVFTINPGALYSTSDALSQNTTLSCAFVQVEFNGVTAANANYKDVQNTTIAFGQQFFAQHYPEDSFRPLHFRFDVATNSIYLKIDLSSEQEFLVLDLDDPTDSYQDFRGFTTGEVYVSVESAGSAGSVTVTKIGDDTFSAVTEDNYSRDMGCLLATGYDFTEMLDGIVGYPYPLPTFADPDGVSAGLEFYDGEGYRDVSGQLADGWTPSQAGQYRIRYTATNQYGYEKTVEGTFTVKESPTEISEETSIRLAADLMGVFLIPRISYIGGTGTLTTAYTISIDGVEKETAPGQALSFTQKGCVAKLIVKVSDAMQYHRTFSYDIEINNNVLRFELIDSFEKITLVSGSTFTVPGYIAIDYAKDDISGNNVEVIIKRGKTRTVSVGDTLEIVSDTVLNYTIDGVTVKTISIRCVPKTESGTGASLGDQFGSIPGVDSVLTNDIGAGFVLEDGNATIDMPYAVSTTNLKISFSVFARSGLTGVKVVIRSLDGKEVMLELKELGTAPVLWINGEETPYQVTTITETYREADTSGLYNKRYYNFSFVFDGAAGKLYNSEMVKIADIGTWYDRMPYDGFTKACAAVSFELTGGNAGDIFVLDTVANQRFTNIHIDSGEVMAPAIGSEGELHSDVVKIGDTVRIPLVYAYDVLDQQADIRMSVYAPDGTLLLNNVLPTAYDLIIRQYGTYSVVYTVSDSKFNTERIRYTFVVTDSVAPVITIDGTYGSYREKDGVTILGATATDNNDDASDVIIWLEYSDLTMVVVHAGDHLTLSAGKYTIVYYAMDSDGNAAIQKYEFEITGGKR